MMSYFLQVDGIEGDATEEAHATWFSVSQFTWMASQFAHQNAGTGAGVGKVSLRPLQCTMAVGASTPLLLTQCASGRHIAVAVLEVVSAGASPATTMRWELGDVLLSSMEIDAATDAPAPSLRLELDYRSLRMTTFTQDDTGGLGQSVTGGWDASRNAPL